jgi:TonB family protein
LSEDLALSKLGPLLDVMDQCVTDLRKVWNVRESAESVSSVRDDAKGDLRRLFSSDDYPWDSVISGEAGDVRVVLLVNEQGRVADCSVVQTSGVALLDAQSCSVLKERAKFVPAIGKDGKPAKDAFVQKINWRVSY